MTSEKLEKVERLLRAEQGVELSPGFKGRVMQAVARLPDPELIAPARSWRDWVYAFRLLGAWEKTAICLFVLGLAALLTPGAGDLLAAWDWELSDLILSVTVGESVVSASIMSLITLGLGGICIAGLGAYSVRNHLISA